MKRLLKKLGFYYQHTHKVADHTSVQGSVADIDFQYVLQNRNDIWWTRKDANKSVKDLPKTIVIYDRSLRNFASSISKDFFEFCTMLLDEDFKIYVWTDTGELTLANTTDSLAHALRNSANSAYRADIEKAAEKAGVILKHSEFLDHDKIRDILTQWKPEKHPYLEPLDIDLYDFRYTNIEEFEEYIATLDPEKAIGLHISKYFEELPFFLAQIISHCKNIKSLSINGGIVVKKDSMAELLEFLNIPIDIFKNLEKINLYYFNNLNALFDLLEQKEALPANLRVLKLYHSQGFSIAALDKLMPKHNSLTEIFIEHVFGLTMDSLTLICKRGKKLKALGFGERVSNDEESQISLEKELNLSNLSDSIQLPSNLKSLKFIGFKFDKGWLSELVSACPNLLELSLADCRSENPVDLDEFKMPNDLPLLRLSIIRGSHEAKSNGLIFQYFPNIEYLKIDSVPDTSFLYDANDLPILSNLKELYIENNKFNQKYLYELLRKSPNLEKLTSAYNKITGTDDEPLPEFKFIREFVGVGTGLEVLLPNFLIKLTSLKKLKLHGIESVSLKKLKNSLPVLMQIMSQLESLTLHNVGQVLAQTLINFAPKLKDLTYTGNPFSESQELALDGADLPSHLKRLALSISGSLESDLKETKLYYFDRLLKNNTNLTLIDFSNTDNNYQDFGEKNKLEEITLRNISVSIDHLVELLKSNPQLKKIRFFQCTIISDDEKILENLDLFLQLKVIDLDGTNLPSVLVDNIKDKVKVYSSIEIKDYFDFKNDNYELDGNVESDPDEQLHATKYFVFGTKETEVPENYYRITVRNKVVCENNTIRLVSEVNDIEIDEVDEVKDIHEYFDQLAPILKKRGVAKGGYELTLIPNKWVPLINIAQYTELNAIQQIPGVEIEKGFSKKTRQSFLKAKNIKFPQKVKIGYVLGKNSKQNVKSVITKNGKYNLNKYDDYLKALRVQLVDNKISFTPESLEAFKVLKNEDRITTILRDYIKEFKEPEENTSEIKQLKQLSGVELINALLEMRIGACRHKAFLYHILLDTFGYDACSVSSQIHDFGERELNTDEWVSECLGGYRSNVSISLSPELANSEIKKTDSVEIKNIQNSLSAANASNENSVLLTPIKKDKAVPLSPNNRFVGRKALKQSKFNSADEFATSLIQQAATQLNKCNVLLTCSSPEQMRKVAFLLRQHAKDNKRKHFFTKIDNISAKETILDDKTNSDREINSQIIDYIHSAKEGDILIADFCEYGSEYVGLNTMLDHHKRQLFGEDIENGVVVIILTTVEDSAKLDDALLSRCTIIADFPDLPIQDYLPKQSVEQTSDKNFLQVNLYHQENWAAKLIGAPKPSGSGYVIKTGKIIEAIDKEAKGIDIQNAPFHDVAFQQFLADLELNRRIYLNGKYYDLPEEFQIIFTEKPYMLEITEFTDKAEWDECINNLNYQDFFKTYQCREPKIYPMDGLLKRYADKELRLLVTGELDEGQWHKFLVKAKKHNVQLKLLSEKSEYLPNSQSVSHLKIATSENISNKTADELMNLSQHKPVTYVVSADPIQTVSDLKLEKSLVIPISEEVKYEDLIERFERKRVNNQWHFSHETCQLWQPSAEVETIIFQGNLSDELACYLQTLFANKPHLNINGSRIDLDKRLIFVGSQAPNFGVSINYYQHTVAPKHVNQYVVPASEVKYNEALMFMAEQLLHTRHLCVLRQSGAGNTIAMIKKLEKFYQKYSDVNKPEKNAKVIFGYKNLDKWLIEGQSQYTILCLTEADLDKPGVLERLEGKQPNILSKSKIYPLTNNHKFVIVSNSYQPETQALANFIERHKAAFLLKRLNYNEILSLLTPIVQASMPEYRDDHYHAEGVAYEIYGYCKNVEDAINFVVEPEQMAMIAMRAAFLNQSLFGNKFDLSIAIKLAVYDEVAYALDKEQRRVLKQALVDPTIKTSLQPHKQSSGKFFSTTKKRRHIDRLLDEHLAIVQMRLNHPQLNTEGLKGLLLEGPPGIGKSTQALTSLQTRGFQPADRITDNNTAKGYYYHVTPTDAKHLENILLSAHKLSKNHIVVVLFDELNTGELKRAADLLEEIMIPTDENGGLFIIATQNPSSGVSRDNLPEELPQFFHPVKLKDYSTEELVDILIFMGLPKKDAEKIVPQYQEIKSHYDLHRKRPAFTPRDLFSEAEQEMAPKNNSPKLKH